ncbi:Trm112 family protein [candidate division KSB1 bacterium]
MLNKEFLDILACPKCKSEKKIVNEKGEEETEEIDLEYDEENKYLICNNCRLKYKIEDDIPVMLIDEAESF